MEIERKFLVSTLPDNLSAYPFHLIEQGYLCTKPVVRIRHQDDDYILTYKSAGMLIREEYNLPLTAKAYEHLKCKIDGNLIRKNRYVLPLNSGLKIELDIFAAPFEGLIIAEVEFPSETSANEFTPPEWFGEEVTFSGKYHNSHLSSLKL